MVDVNTFKVNEEWIRCYDPMSDCIGIVPLSFVHIYVEDEVRRVNNKWIRASSIDRTATTTSANDQKPQFLKVHKRQRRKRKLL